MSKKKVCLWFLLCVLLYMKNQIHSMTLPKKHFKMYKKWHYSLYTLQWSMFTLGRKQTQPEYQNEINKNPHPHYLQQPLLVISQATASLCALARTHRHVHVSAALYPLLAQHMSLRTTPGGRMTLHNVLWLLSNYS